VLTRHGLSLGYVQVCILIDPSLTLAETTAADDSSGDGSRKGPGHGSSSGGGGGGTEGPLSNEVDTKKLVQVGPTGSSAHNRVAQSISVAVQGETHRQTDPHCGPSGDCSGPSSC